MKNIAKLKTISFLKKRSKTDISKPKEAGSICLNCQTNLVGSFCHNCGQKNIVIKRPLMQIIAHIFDSLFSLDNKLFRTLPALIIKPGFLSKEFIDGKRIRYTTPFKLFMFSSIFCFFLLGISEGDSKGNITIESDISLNESPKADPLENSMEAKQIAQAKGADNRINQKIQQITSNPTKYKARIYKALSYMFFVLMPLFALLLMLLTRKKQRVYIEHLVHSVHIHSFGFCIFSIVLLLDLAFGNNFSTIYYIVFAILLTYIILSIKNFYNRGWLYSIWKSIQLVSIYSVLFILTMISSMLVAILL